MIKLEVSFATTGKEGRCNQDNFMVDKFIVCGSGLDRFSGKLETDNSEKRIFVVSDGAGGGCDGEKASDITVHTFGKFAEYIKCSDTEIALLKSLDEANQEVCDYFEKIGDTGAATVSGLIFDKDKVWVFNAGDSPVFCLEKGVLERVSCEHTVAAEEHMENCGNKATSDSNTITRYMGNFSKSGSEQTDISCFTAQRGMVWLIASDGVEKGLSDSKIKRILSKDNENIAEKIVKKAYLNGSEDDITAVVIRLLA